MKRIGFAVWLMGLALLVACNSDKSNYVIFGKVPAGIENGEKVYMVDYHEGVKVDSAVIFSGKFQFKGIVDLPKVISLSNRFGLQADMILDKGTQSVDLSDPFNAKGNRLTELLCEFYQKCTDAIMLTRSNISNIDEKLSEEEKDKKEEELYKNLFALLDEIPLSFLKEHPDDVLGAMIFYIWLENQPDMTVDRFREKSQSVGATVLGFGPVKQMAERLEKVDKTSVGKPFVDFTVSNGNLDGSSVSFSNYIGKGKYVLVDFWASWCMPCRMEAPVIADVYKKYKGDRFEVLGVAVMDKRAESLKAIEDDGYTWPQILDAQAVPLELYGIQGIPHIILFGPDGTILARDLRGDALKNKVAEVLKTGNR